MSKHPIIANGEVYAEPISKKPNGFPKKLPREFFEAKERITTALDNLTHDIEESEEIFLDEKIICIRLEPKFEAMSYIPTKIIDIMTNCSFGLIGGRKYSIQREEGISAKLYFVRTTDKGINQLKTTIRSGVNDEIQLWQQQLCSVNTINLLQPDEKIMGFPDEWQHGTVEFVLHPLPSNINGAISNFFEHSGINAENAKIKTYSDGLTFISAPCTSKNIQQIKGYNPLRAVHPMGNIRINPIRKITNSICPSILPSYSKPEINIGVFDGGADNSLPLLKGYVTPVDVSKEPPTKELIEHGSGVCNAILHGNLAERTDTDILDPPCLSIDCYRVLPIHDYQDYDLYEIIDFIEKIVPISTQTKLYNLSFGPEGAIVDDSISRFTYALDKLAYEVPENTDNPLFVVAIGNDGELSFPFNRIQAPSDIVNGLGIGAYTYNMHGEKLPTSYSCVGPGREGAKTKPDLLEFGGSIDYPFIIPALDRKSLCATAGTSFAAPMVTGKIGKLMAMSDRVSPHMGRTLLIHSAKNDESITKHSQGFGFCIENVSDILECTDKNVTIMYSGTILPSQYLSLPIFAPHINDMKGNVTISWIVAIVVAPYANDPDAYTNNCLEDVFVPHSMKYNFTKRGMPTETINLLDESQIPIVKQLINDGYKQSSTPKSHAAKKFKNEKDLRAVELKWDTVIHKTAKLRSNSLFNPSLTLHALGRNSFEAEPIRYNVAISINAPKYEGSLYDSILQTYHNLTPIEIRNIGRLTI